ncbi:MAG TPA: PAS domain S-box protein [Candidatus Acidoferrales bacterium]|nr:PAS domain S-box protein [Candidatus Acidoferrales bacterium]
MDGRNRKTVLSPWVRGILLALISIGLIICGILYYLAERSQIRSQRYEEIAAITNLKVREIDRWRLERLADARVLSKSPLTRQAILDLIRARSNMQLRATVEKRLALEQRLGLYVDAFVVDTIGRTRISIGASSSTVDTAEEVALHEAVTERKTVVTDLFRSADGRILIDAMDVVLDESGRPAAVIVLRSDADNFLYPLIDLWPVPSRSAETILLEKQGDEIIFLNNLLFRPGSALEMRVPLSSNMPLAVQAASGKVGMFEGKDYRGKDVLADLSAIPDTPWLMVAKVDASEILAEATYRGGVVILLVILFIVLSMVATGYAYRRSQVTIYRELYQAETALLQSEERFRGLVEGSTSAIWIHDGKNFLYANPAALQITGYSFDELSHLNVEGIVHPDFRKFVMEQVEKRIKGGEIPKQYEYQIVRKNGEEVWIDFSDAVIDYQGKQAIIASAYDITDRKRLEEQLVQAQKMEAIGRLAGGVAHDYNNMLGVIIGYTDLIAMNVKKDDPIRRYVELIASASKRGADLTRQLLAFARREMVSPKPIDPNKAIDSLQKMLGKLIGEDIMLKFFPGKNIWNVKIDPTQFDQILINLATNARDAIDGVGEIVVETSNIVVDEAYTKNKMGFAPGEYMMLIFSDNGKGMDRETVNKIFEPFFTTKERGRGTGLGLSTLYGIVGQNGGNIDVFSEPGEGTTFKIYLPRYHGKLEGPEPEGDASGVAGSETILIVEDEGELLELAKNSLEEYGYKVLTSLSPERGISLCETCQDRIHLLLTDVVMPAMNGKELRDRVRMIKPDIKTLFMSGYTAEIIAHRGVLEEDVEFIQKPFTPYALAKKVHEVLNS